MTAKTFSRTLQAPHPQRRILLGGDHQSRDCAIEDAPVFNPTFFCDEVLTTRKDETKSSDDSRIELMFRLYNFLVLGARLRQKKRVKVELNIFPIKPSYFRTTLCGKTLGATPACHEHPTPSPKHDESCSHLYTQKLCPSVLFLSQWKKRIFCLLFGSDLWLRRAICLHVKVRPFIQRRKR